MQIVRPSIAGTLESSDAQVTVEPYEGGICVEIESSVINQYGRQIKKVVLKTLEDLEVNDALVLVVDKGALDCTIRARVQCAVFRAAAHEGAIPWKEASGQ